MGFRPKVCLAASRQNPVTRNCPSCPPFTIRRWLQPSSVRGASLTNEIAASASSCKSGCYEDLILTLQKGDYCNALLAAYTKRLVSFRIIPDKSEHSTEVDTSNPDARSLNPVTILIETPSDNDYSENLLGRLTIDYYSTNSWSAWPARLSLVLVASSARSSAVSSKPALPLFNGFGEIGSLSRE
jgi:hypothetical protein